MFAFARILLLLTPLFTGIFSFSLQSHNLTANEVRANSIREAFVKSYAEYERNADGHDRLLPLSRSYDDELGGWGATLIQAVDTAHLMGLHSMVDRSIAKIKKIDFSVSQMKENSLFIASTGNLASLVSIYQLTGKKHPELLEQAVVIADKLLKGWIHKDAIAYDDIPWNGTAVPDGNGVVNIAQAGSILLEFAKLSELTLNSTYLDHARRAMDAIVRSDPIWPGLITAFIDPRNLRPAYDLFTWGPCGDSGLESMIKYPMLTGSARLYSSTWEQAVASSIKRLITVADGHPDLFYMTDFSAISNGNLYRGTELGCFAPGLWILGGKALGNSKIIDYGLRMAESCWRTWSSSATGIGPESFGFVGMGNKTNGANITSRKFYERNGFNYQDRQYILRPDMVETMFYAYRITGNPIWQERSWSAFNALKQYCLARTGATDAFTSIADVSNTSTAQHDMQWPFVYGETLKYMYLTQTTPETGSLDRYVYQTGAHLLEYQTPSSVATPLVPTCADLQSCLNHDDRDILVQPEISNLTLYRM